MVRGFAAPVWVQCAGAMRVHVLLALYGAWAGSGPMMRQRRRLAWVSFAILCVAEPAVAAPTPGFGAPDPLGIGNASRDVTRHALPPPDVTEPREAAASANPLWVVPLAALWATRDRPLFAPSRRSPAPILADVPAPAPSQQPAPRTGSPEHLNLSLVGIVSAENQGVAVFIDPSTHDAVRLRTGEGHLGWILQSVDRRTATLQKSGQTETLELPRPVNLPGPSPVVTTLPPPGAPVVDQHRGCPQELFGCRMHTE